MSRARAAWRQASLMQGSFASSFLLGLLILPLVTRGLGPTEFGKYALFGTLLQLMVNFAHNWTADALVRFGGEEFVQTGVIRRVFWARGLLVAGILVMAWMSTPVLRLVFFEFTGLPDVAYWLFAGGLTIALVAQHVGFALQAMGNVERYAVTNIVERATFLALTVPASLLHMLSAVSAIVIGLAARLAQAGAGVLRLPARSLLPVEIHMSVVGRILRYSWPILLMDGLGYVSLVLEPYIIKRSFSEADVGLFQVAFQVNGLLVGLFLMPLATVLFPLFAELRARSRDGDIVRVLEGVVPHFVFLFGIGIATAMPLVTWMLSGFLGAPFVAAADALMCLLVSAAFQAVSVVYDAVLKAHDSSRARLATNLAGTVVFVLGVLILIPALGIAGAALNWIVWYAFTAVAYTSISRTRVKRWIPTTFLGPACALGAVVVNLRLTGPANRLAASWLLVSVCVIVARRSGIFRGDELGLLERAPFPARAREALIWVFTVFTRRLAR